MYRDILFGVISGFTIFMFIILLIAGKFTSYKDPKFEEVQFEYIGPLYDQYENDVD